MIATDKKCICITTGYFAPHHGGVEKYTYNLSRQLSNKGFKVIIVTTNSEFVNDSEYIGNIELIRLPVFKLFRKRYPLLNIFHKRYRYYINYLKKQKIDYYILNTRFYLTTFLGLRLSFKKNKKSIIIEHGTGHFVSGNFIINFCASQYEHLLTSFVKTFHPLFFGVSEACNNWLKHYKITADGVVYNGIDANLDLHIVPIFRKKYNIPDNHLILSCASRLIPEKGAIELLNAFIKANSKYENMHLIIAGDGPLLDDIHNKYGGINHIHITGKITYEEVMTLFHESDIVINPSRYPEGLPTVILEAGLANRAMISTAMGGAKEVIENGYSGIIINQCSESEIASAIEELYLNPEKRVAMANNLYKNVTDNFNWNKITEGLLSSDYFKD